MDSRLYLGVDVGRHKDSTIVTLTEFGGDGITRIIVMEEFNDEPYDNQRALISKLMREYKIEKCYIDRTGIGDMLYESLFRDWGSKIDGIWFSNKIKESLISNLFVMFRDKLIRIPNDKKLIEELHSLKKTATSSGFIKFDTDSTKHHCDRVWSLALACKFRIKEGDKQASFGKFKITEELKNGWLRELQES